ncbi:MAG: glycosyl hydrolase family 95 catalytic domain-containing protein [Flavisolibacter sp.]
MIRKILLSSLFFFIVHFAFAQQDLKLWYNKPSAKWTDALPIGNGRLGAMIFGGVDTDRIQFNEETLWTGEPRDYNRKGAYKYLPQLRQLLFEGKQKEAEQLAEEQFMGLQSGAGNKEAWFKKVRGQNNLIYASAKFDDSKWKDMQVPSYDGWEAVGFQGLDGAVWLRTGFDLPANWKGEDLVLDLNRIRDQDFTYVNGKLIGSMDNTDQRKYTIPKDVLVSGKNIIAVQVLNYFDKGGIAGYKDTSRYIGVYPKGKENEKISLVKNWKYFIQDDEPPATQHYQADYQPFGDVWLNFTKPGLVSNYKRELDISNAVARTSYTVDGVDYSREYFASQPDQVIAIHLTASKVGSINLDCLLNSPHKYSFTQKADDKTLQLSVKVKNGALKGESYLRVQTKNGKSVIQGNKLIVTGADEVTLYLTAATNYKNYKDVTGNPVSICKNAIANTNVKSYDQIKSASIKEYQKYSNTLSVDFGNSENEKLPTDERIDKFASSSDPSLLALYMQYGRYLLIASSRPGTRPANLQGIWNDLLTPPWGSKYTTNINVEMNYWPSELLNLSPLQEPLFKMIDELAQSGKETAREYYDAPGWVLHHNTDLWRGTAPINASNHGIWVGGSGWLSHHFWEHYLFTQDKAFLKNRAYPIMKQSALFYNSYLVRDPKTGWLISGPSNSPEHGGLVMGPSMDHEIIRSLFRAVIKAGEILNVDKSLRDTLQRKLSLIAPNQIGRYGQLQEWLQDVDDTSDKHRHVSHLWAAYPGNEINWDETADFMKAARQSLIYRGDAATGWSLAWKINLWARFKDGDHTYKLLQMLLSPAEKFGEGSYHNLFDAHPPFQIDGNFGGAAGIGEMLVQSHTKYIDLLPALPSALPGGEIKGICARGGFQLNLKWKDGNLQLIDVISLAGNDCLLRYNGKTKLLKTVKGKTYKLNGNLQLL